MFKETKIYQLAQSMKALRGREKTIFKEVLDTKLVKELIVNLNTEQQLGEEHVDSLGNRLFNQFTNRTTYATSDPLGRGGQPYEVFQTGEYYDSFRVTITNGSIIIDSNPEKPDGNLFEMYNPDIEGLTESSKEALIELVRELYIKWIRDYVGRLV